MGLLKEVQNDQARAKVGAFGSQGSGKTTTLALLAIGISKTYHNGAPVAMMDTEAGADFLKPVFNAEGIKLMVHKSGAFSDMVKVLQEAEETGCCAFIMDSVTHTWRELVDSYCAAMAKRYNQDSYDPQFQDWKDIKAQWAVWTNRFVNSPVHCFIAGRAGYEYSYEVNAKGKRELIKGDSKMKTEGEFGYEPSLLIEMEAVRQKTNKQHKGGSLTHIAHVLKDRARSLNGRQFEFPDMNEYKPGDWKTIFEPFKPHFSFLNIAGTQKSILPNTSEELFDSETGETEARQRYQAKKIALDEILATMQLLWPGQASADKAVRIRVLETLFGVRGWSAVESMSLRKVEDGLWALHEFETAARDAQPEDDQAVLRLLQECIAKVGKPGYRPGEAGLDIDDGGHRNVPALKPVGNPSPESTAPAPAQQTDEDTPTIYYSNQNGNVILTGATYVIRGNLKAAGGVPNREKGIWTLPAEKWDTIKSLCGKTGIQIAYHATDDDFEKGMFDPQPAAAK